MNLSDLHRRLLSAVIDIGAPYPLVLTGGYAVQAHGLVDRLSQDLDVATEDPSPMAEIVAVLAAGLVERGWQVRVIDVDSLSARLMATDTQSGDTCEVDVLKEHFWAPPAQTEYGPVLAFDSVIGTKVRALADRGAVRDLIDVHAAPATAAPPNSNVWANATGATSSGWRSCATASSARTGPTTPSSRRTASPATRRPSCATGPGNGPTTSPGVSTSTMTRAKETRATSDAAPGPAHQAARAPHTGLEGQRNSQYR